MLLSLSLSLSVYICDAATDDSTACTKTFAIVLNYLFPNSLPYSFLSLSLSLYTSVTRPQMTLPHMRVGLECVCVDDEAIALDMLYIHTRLCSDGVYVDEEAVALAICKIYTHDWGGIVYVYMMRLLLLLSVIFIHI